MRELFYEESVKDLSEKRNRVKFNIFNVLSYVSFVLSLAWFIIALLFFEFSKQGWLLSVIIFVLPFIAFCALGFVFAIVRNKYCVDYDYTFVSGSFSFSKIIHNTKRKDILSFDCVNIEKIGPYGSALCEKYEQNEDIKIVYLTNNKEADEGKYFYYMVVNFSGVKYFLILECTPTFISNIKLYANRYVFDEELN